MVQNFESIVGSKAEVWHGKAQFVNRKGGLQKKDLIMNAHGKIVSKAKSQAAKNNKNLGNFLIDKGTSGFGLRPKKGSSEYKQLKKSLSMSNNKKPVKKSNKKK